MGPRTYVAQRLTDFLLDHGDLDARVRRLELRQCRQAQPNKRSWARFIDEREVAPHPSVDAAAMLVAACLLVHHTRKGRDWQRRLRWSASSVMSAVALVAATLSCYLVSLLLLSAFEQWNQIVSGTAGEKTSAPSSLLTRDLLDRYLFLSSLCCILLSVLLTLARVIWGFLDPTGIAERATTADAAAILSSLVVLWLAYVHLPLFRHTLHGDFDHNLLYLLQHTTSSFVAFCLFYKLVHRGAPTAGGTMRRPKKQQPLDPELVRRMSNLAREARERVRSRKARHFRRTYSEGNFRVLASPDTVSPSSPTGSAAKTKRRSGGPCALLPLHEGGQGTTPQRAHAERHTARSPLLDISQAGPTLSGRDLLAKLRHEACLKRSMSTNSLTSTPLVLVPTLVDEDMAF